LSPQRPRFDLNNDVRIRGAPISCLVAAVGPESASIADGGCSGDLQGRDTVQDTVAMSRQGRYSGLANENPVRESRIADGDVPEERAR
jgi:hypothetical protein